MHVVKYAHRFPYRADSASGNDRPTLVIALTSAKGASVDVDAHLDTGAERSVFDGSYARLVDLDLLEGRAFRLSSTAGPVLEARLHRVRLTHSHLGDFDLEVAFTTVPIRRNLLGRDFLRHVQVGFRELHAEFFISLEAR